MGPQYWIDAAFRLAIGGCGVWFLVTIARRS
jgi:hypothetical protein